jgi:acetylornithine deacetylase/succinyl-diaminopimelate desuccinylase-like protein
MRTVLTALAATALLATGARAAPDDAGLTRFRATYKELVETNTTLSSGDCTLAASRMAARLKAAGYPDADLHLFVPEGHPREGGLVAVLHGTDPQAKAVLMLAHIDVVEAKRADWARDPFTLIEEGGYFYARGSSDMKAQAAIWVDNTVRYREEGLRPRSSIKLALTCGEETNSALNGAGWLATHERDLIDARLALTEGSSGVLDPEGKRVALEVLGGREDFPELRTGERQSGRSQFTPGRGQCDLSPGPRGRPDQPIRVSGADRRRQSRLLHRHGRDRRR